MFIPDDAVSTRQIDLTLFVAEGPADAPILSALPFSLEPITEDVILAEFPDPGP